MITMSDIRKIPLRYAHEQVESLPLPAKTEMNELQKALHELVIENYSRDVIKNIAMNPSTHQNTLQLLVETGDIEFRICVALNKFQKYEKSGLLSLIAKDFADKVF